MAVPTRTEVQNKINEIREDPTFSTIQGDMWQRIYTWLESIHCPAPNLEKIMDDLVTYEGY